MKKLLSFLLAICMAVLAVPVAMPAQTDVNAAEKVVYLKKGGTGDGSSDQSPVNTLTKAYQKLGNGGTIVICGDFELTANYTEPAHTNPITITQVYGGKDYRNGTANSMYIKTKGKRFFLNGPTTFENINFKGDTSATNNFILFIAQFNPITMGEGIKSIDFTGTTIAKSLGIVGGCQDTNTATLDLDPNITIKSGRFVIVGFSRMVNATYTGCAHINFEGGELVNLYAGSVDNGKGGDANITISGGKINGTLNASSLVGAVNITVTGGDFSSCKAINGKSNSTIDISRHSDADAINDKISDFGTVITESGISEYIPPNEAFESGSFTDSKGTTIPYRYYLPKNYDSSKSYPLVLYMHGNGSRGTDNEIQLTTNGAALNTKIYQSEYECIMLAPQCPAAPNAWVAKDRYPGNITFVGSTDMSKHLNAAKELFDKFVDEYAVDTSRIYVTGSSNGGGATWELVYRFPHTFAAAVPLAGCGSTSGVAEIAEGYIHTPIYTFHGDADATVSVAGTRAMAAAIKAAGGDITYVEIPGGDHNIWSAAANTAGLVDWIFSQVNDNYSPNERNYKAEPDIEAPEIDNVSFGTKDLGNGEYAVRAQFKIASEYFVGENADDYNIVELGVLVATKANAEAIKYFKGAYHYGVTEFAADPENFEDNIGKSVAYVKEANADAYSYDAYAWAGADADDTAVYFTAPIYEIDAANLGTEFVFVPYVVGLDEAGQTQVFYGDATDAVSYNSILAMPN